MEEASAAKVEATQEEVMSGEEIRGVGGEAMVVEAATGKAAAEEAGKVVSTAAPMAASTAASTEVAPMAATPAVTMEVPTEESAFEAGDKGEGVLVAKKAMAAVYWVGQMVAPRAVRQVRVGATLVVSTVAPMGAPMGAPREAPRAAPLAATTVAKLAASLVAQMVATTEAVVAGTQAAMEGGMEGRTAVP